MVRNGDLGTPCQRVEFRICCDDRPGACLTVSPVPEMTNTLEGVAESFRNQNVMVVGAADRAGFQFWDFQVMAEFARPDGRDSGLRAIVAAAGAAGGRVVRVRGQFRGRNLFGDLPPESSRGGKDWVLADQGVAVWVTGRAPKGDGWALDLDERSASERWLEVEGEVKARDGVVYLKARTVSLVGGPKPVAVRN
jgi:hypothetical protein